ncbi:MULTISPECIES: helix-turn-helix domain-containing protein [Streptomyces]|uniref:helix-turn-helix domain-containing protein n=1 Tax=Streptomyces TaxID=1883 RepID=UPI001416D5F2|nr:hypothetical protein [Streptomyces sp. SID7805]MYU55055.1 hypothetical protein [Streptomyces sp. SID7805]
MSKYRTRAVHAAAKEAALVDKEDIFKRFSNGESIGDLEHSLGVTYAWIRKLLTDYGFTLRGGSNQAAGAISRATCLDCFTLWKRLDEAVQAVDMEAMLRASEVLYLHANTQHRSPPDFRK